MSLAGGQHIVVGIVLLQDTPHPIDKISRMSPISLCIEIANIELRLLAVMNGRHRARNLSRNEGLAACRPLVIE